MTVDEVRATALALPGAYGRPSHGGQPSWRTKPRRFATIREDLNAAHAGRSRRPELVGRPSREEATTWT